MSDLSVENILEIHNEIIGEYGGTYGVRDLATIENLIYYRMSQSAGVIVKSAIALHSICTEHPFVDGNKRTAFVIADNLLKEGGYNIHATNSEVVDFMLKVAEYTQTVESVEKWLKENTD